MEDEDDRDRAADQRDRAATLRDDDAAESDRVEAARDALLRGDPGQTSRRRAVGRRAKSVKDRQASASDRLRSAWDRADAKTLRDASTRMGRGQLIVLGVLIVAIAAIIIARVLSAG